MAVVALLDGAVLFFALQVATIGAGGLGFSRPDEIAIAFCGSKKSFASGVPMAGVLFPAGDRWPDDRAADGSVGLSGQGRGGQSGRHAVGGDA